MTSPETLIGDNPSATLTGDHLLRILTGDHSHVPTPSQANSWRNFQISRRQSTTTRYLPATLNLGYHYRSVHFRTKEVQACRCCIGKNVTYSQLIYVSFRLLRTNPHKG